VNVAFARKFGLLAPGAGGADFAGVIGKLMSYNGTDTLDTQIVGLVQNAKYSTVKDSVPPVFFTPYRQDANAGHLNFYVRTSMAPDQILPAIPKLIKRLAPLLPVEGLKTMPQQVQDNVFLTRMIGILSASFAVLATLLAAIGLYGVLAY